VTRKKTPPNETRAAAVTQGSAAAAKILPHKGLFGFNVLKFNSHHINVFLNA
jgi:hypothetical protein